MNYKLVGLGIMFLLCWMGCCPPACRSAVVWADDFNDMNTDGWEIWGMNYTEPAPLPGSYSVSEGMLRFQGVTGHWTIASYNIAQGVGTWSFDLDVQDQDRHHFYVAFFGGYWDNDSINWSDWLQSVPYEYGIAPFTGSYSSYDTEFVLFRASPARGSFVALDRYSPPEMIGWHHIDITRDSSGLYNFYLNGTLRMSATDTTYTTTECFKIYSGSGPAIDNIVVQDILPTTIDPLIIAVIGGVALVVIVIVIVIIVRIKRKS
ncbi:MAG: hypothetical protein ACFE89_12660 [Candidatus Hodarchaeota archaeon]